jgi:hypothetical protein
MSPLERSADPAVDFYPLEVDKDGCSVAFLNDKVNDDSWREMGVSVSL